MDTYLLLPHLKIHNANAFSSIYTIGIPAMTSWLGFTHALERRINVQNATEKVEFAKTAVIIHDYHLHSHRLRGNNYNSLAVTANPLKKKGSEFERPPFIAEGRIDLEVSILISVNGVNSINEEIIKSEVNKNLYKMKIAGGDILPNAKLEKKKNKIIYDDGFNTEFYYIEEELEKEKELRGRLRKGYAIIERRDLMIENNSEGDDLDKLLDYLKVNFKAKDSDDKKVIWEASKKTSGWIVPIVTGYRGIQSSGNVNNQRDVNYEHQFVEPVVTLGEFKTVYGLDSLEDMMWKYHAENDLYVCVNNN